MPFMATVLACSLYSVHCLIPPHPGALAAAGIVNANIGLLILIGTLFAIPAAVAAYFWSRFITKGKNYPSAEIPASAQQPGKVDLPPVFLSFLPIVVPLILITIRSLLNLIDQDKSNLVTKIFNIAGEPVIALSIGVLLALLLIKGKSVKTINEVISEAIEKAGPILIITAAGGMFGMVIKSTGTGEALGKLLAGSNIGILVPFLIAGVMKTAQGSSTVAIITTASFIGPMLALLGLDSEWGRILAMLSMGAGSMLISHANDSYFWVVTKFSEIDPSTTLKVYSSSTIVMGSTVLFLVWLTSFFVL